MKRAACEPSPRRVITLDRRVWSGPGRNSVSLGFDPSEEAGVAEPPHQLVLEDRRHLGRLAAVILILDGRVCHRKPVDRDHLIRLDVEAGRQPDEAGVLILDVGGRPRPTGWTLSGGTW